VALETYRKNRQCGVTPELRGRKGPGGGYRYVIQKHSARQLHYDLRLELAGVMKSWAVTRGPSLDPNEKRRLSRSRIIRTSTTRSKAPSRKANMAAGR